MSVSARGLAYRFLIADDHAIFAESLRIYLEKSCTIVGIAQDGRAMIEEAIRLRPDGVIVDVGMPRLNGLDAARRIKQQIPHIKFIFLTMHDDPTLAAAALDALGTIGFVLKHSAGTELLTAMGHVLRGQSYMTPKLRAVDWVESKARARQFSQELTPRQRDIIQLLAEGRCMKEIAHSLNLSCKTIEFHKRHIMRSFGLRSNAYVVLFAVKHHLVSAPVA